MADDVDIPESDDVLTPDAIANHTFHTAFRGFDPVEVRAFLARVADALRTAEEAASAAPREDETVDDSGRSELPPELAGADPDAIVAAAVAEAEEVLRDARERARHMEEEAVAEGRRLVDKARAEGEALREQARADADAELRSAKSKARAEVGREATRLRAEAEQAAAGARVDAERHAAKVKQDAEQEAAAIIEAARERGREMVVEAQAARERMLTDLARRKRAAQAQIEQLRAGRDRLLETLKSARRTVDEVTLRFDASGEPTRRERGDDRGADVTPAEERAEAPPGPADAGAPAGVPPERERDGERAAPGLPALPEQPGVASEGVRIIGSRPTVDAPRARDVAARASASPSPPDAEASRARPEAPPAETGEPAPEDGRRSERKSSALRILRRARSADRDEAKQADAGEVGKVGRAGKVAPPEPGEGVRILAPHAAEAPEPAGPDPGLQPEDVPADAAADQAPGDGSDAAVEAVEAGGGDPRSESTDATDQVAEPAEPAEPGKPEKPATETDEMAEGAQTAEGAKAAAGPAEAPAGAVAEREAEGGRGVDDIFARIRAEREAATAAARAVLADSDDGAGADEAGAAEAGTTPVRAEADRVDASGDAPLSAVAGADSGAADAPDGTAGSEPTAATEAPGSERVSNADEAVLQQRDAAVAELEDGLTRRLKRTLQDEQNAALDRLRTHRGALSADSLLGTAEEQAAPYRDVARTHLEPAARAGAASSPMGTAAVSVDDLAGQLAADIAESLRQRLDVALEQATRDEQELAAVAERVNSTYREWKTQRIQRMTLHYVNAAYNRGIFLATPEGTPLRWLVDDEGPCPDCDDNALSGATPRGEAYPTGQMLPPAHVGCRCLLVRATT